MTRDALLERAAVMGKLASQTIAPSIRALYSALAELAAWHAARAPRP